MVRWVQKGSHVFRGVQTVLEAFRKGWSELTRLSGVWRCLEGFGGIRVF